MYHPSRGGVRGGRDQFKWDDVKVDKHRENYLGHSIKAPVGRWQKGKDLFWYNRDKKSEKAESEAIKEEIKRIKEDEEQAMREALGLAPKRANRLQGNRLDKHEYAELVKRGTTAEDMGAGHAEAAQVQGLGLYKLPRNQSESSTQPHCLKEIGLGKNYVDASAAARDDETPDDQARKKRRHEERGDEVRTREEKKDDKRRGEKRRDKREEKRSYDTGEKLNYRHRDKGKRRHDSD